ncbi:MoxR-like ATPase [Clostridium pasteurianum DSM 525 = ATCC 6013]|uniref:ATPase associated with various cellular activities AAA_3 n=1 Tax=Clostridium pasteurianum DSM 525 = ATCC 6013 TaxID=1262449 RepID=A0A0H3J4C3_CLOPA|nr:MoxR family ATPase [Clostridium pasteurianum]AJA48786.1 MoxR-like ATPase [Clostridium pasteurianum DSM 525 = ATCC 6013]AJA52774.1 MoxR-like ATPase [Clostridium pasteurianum DSM 525 = ATCC 6013]AOZ76007.1 magnesium chelatase [Clostridium pasteurianum DSM 525 = ATCC 6013]AOZ79803.1 magnesium chelatase [Clostridium pasteurianum]ELP60084.1 MoxR-like ATPase [Clostridium pasteurianum DSM 525 = ATCC 6013]
MENNQEKLVKNSIDKITSELKKVIVEQDELIEFSLISLICGGHVLLEGVPGLAKTLMVKALSKIISMEFKRIQFTPDLMPADVTGTKIFNMQTREFELKKGPIFTNLLLADEINRTPPKTQAGLLEAMAENTVSIDGEMISLPSPYMVLATQNPLEYEGTYPLPEALIDRFLMKLVIDYPSIAAEKEVLKRHHQGLHSIDLDNYNLQKVCTAETILKCRREVQSVGIEDSLMKYIVSIISETRNNPLIDIGSSPRGSIAVLECSKAYAAYSGRDYVIPEDIKKVVIPTLRHRIILKPELELEGVNPEQVLSDILSKVKVPR